MKRRPLPSDQARRWARAGSAALACGLLALAPASAMYKVVQPDGSVTYTDRPPAGTSARVTPLGSNASPVPGSSEGSLPFALRQAMQRYPVTLYTSADCAPCASGRQLLQQRGVPFRERLVLTEDDAAALDRLVGGRTVPALTIGNQALRGLAQGDWTAYLDAAGYPRESVLPRNWPQPAATPLVERRTVGAPGTAGSTPARPAEAPAAEAGTDVPATSGGIRF